MTSYQTDGFIQYIIAIEKTNLHLLYIQIKYGLSSIEQIWSLESYSLEVHRQLYFQGFLSSKDKRHKVPATLWPLTTAERFPIV